MISHSIYAIIGQFNPDGVKYAGYFEIWSKSGEKRVILDSVLSSEDAECLCSLHCMELGVKSCYFYTRGGSLIAAAWVNAY